MLAPRSLVAGFLAPGLPLLARSWDFEHFSAQIPVLGLLEHRSTFLILFRARRLNPRSWPCSRSPGAPIHVHGSKLFSASWRLDPRCQMDPAPSRSAANSTPGAEKSCILCRRPRDHRNDMAMTWLTHASTWHGLGKALTHTHTHAHAHTRCPLYTSPSPRDRQKPPMPHSA